MFSTEVAYQEWLKGTSLRKLANKYGCSQTHVHQKLRERFGVSACNITLQSTARSVFQDYPEYPEVAMQLLDVPGRVMSRHTEDMYSKHQVVNNMYYISQIAQPDNNTELSLNFYGFTKLVDCIVYILKEYVQETE